MLHEVLCKLATLHDMHAVATLLRVCAGECKVNHLVIAIPLADTQQFNHIYRKYMHQTYQAILSRPIAP